MKNRIIKYKKESENNEKNQKISKSIKKEGKGYKMKERKFR